jgi:hypothetical protein
MAPVALSKDEYMAPEKLFSAAAARMNNVDAVDIPSKNQLHFSTRVG